MSIRRYKEERGRTVFQGVVFGEVLQVASLHACEVFYLTHLSSMPGFAEVMHTRAWRMFIAARREETNARTVRLLTAHSSTHLIPIWEITEQAESAGVNYDALKIPVFK